MRAKVRLAIHNAECQSAELFETSKFAGIAFEAALAEQPMQLPAEVARTKTSEACTVTLCRLRAVCTFRSEHQAFC
jgi:hypothetical protein